LCYNIPRMLKRVIVFLLLPALLPAARAEKKKIDLLQDAAIVSAVTCVYVLVLSDTRRRIFREASMEKVWKNFADPIRSAIDGGKMDHNGFWINCVAHPLSFACLGLYLKERGYSNGGALLFSQTVNVIWEYVIEGSLWLPSGKDLISDLCGSLAAIYVLAPLSDGAEKRIAAGDRRWGTYLLYYLNPFKKINRWLFGPKQNGSGLYIFPARAGFVAGLHWQG
ncbi:MAG TPA: DUF3943 domain-containing protein, partial [Candidatus Binatia bacterium]|nr:DUF3943 domain-containing protein [Candidatus Binatia bacterium]